MEREELDPPPPFTEHPPKYAEPGQDPARHPPNFDQSQEETFPSKGEVQIPLVNPVTTHVSFLSDHAKKSTICPFFAVFVRYITWSKT
jgi:hypothetical protein